MSAASQTCATLFTGKPIPFVGLGTWKSKDDQAVQAVQLAIEAGYRHIDCAAVYGNEVDIGKTLKVQLTKSGGNLKREDLFLTSKLWNTKHRAEDVKPALLKTLADLQLDYLDLYLIHWPLGFRPGNDPFPKNPDGSMLYDDTHFLETWGALEKCVEEGLVKHIGLSNFNSQQIDLIMSKCTIQPAVLQCESHPYLNQKELIAHCKKYNILFEAYSPLGSPDRPWAKPEDPIVLKDPTVAKIAEKYGKSPAQVLIRFHVDRGVAVLPKSATPDRIKANIDVFDFKLSEEDITALESLGTTFRYVIPMVMVEGKPQARDRNHPFFPFNIPY